ncbi:MAG: hypothetical protein JWP89_2730 [Schlesneria sp.]|nr:hypothetical protein [Schlesneria sp.]
MEMDRPQQNLPRLDGRSFSPSFGLYRREPIARPPKNMKAGTKKFFGWLQSLSVEQFKTVLPQSMGELLAWLREHRDTIAIILTVRRRIEPAPDENSQSTAYRQAAAVLVDGIAWLNFFAANVIIEPRCNLAADASAFRQLDELIEIVKRQLTPEPEPRFIEIAETAAPKGSPGRKPDEAKTQHAKRANELRSQNSSLTWKECASAINLEFHLMDEESRYDAASIRHLHRLKHGDKSQKKKRD